MCSRTKANQDLHHFDYLLFEYSKYPNLAREILLGDLAIMIKAINLKMIAQAEERVRK